MLSTVAPSAINHWLIKLSLFINYGIFAVLLNSVGTVILQVQYSFDVRESSAGILEAYKDLSIAITCFLIASFVTRIGYKRSMLIALSFVGLACLAMPQLPSFWMTKLLFAAVGVSFALVKVSVFATLALVTHGQREHASLMNFIEAFFMFGVLSGYFIFSAFIVDADPGSIVWLNVYYPLALAVLLAFVLLLVSPLDESAVAEEQAGSSAKEFGSGIKGYGPGAKGFIDMLRLAAKPMVLVFIVCAFIYVLIEQSIMSWLPTFNSKILNLSASLSVQVASILAASTALGRFVAGMVLKRFHWYWVLNASLLAAACLVLVALPLAAKVSGEQVTSWLQAPLAAFLFPLIGFCLAPIYPAINSTILSALPRAKHASMAGLIVVFSALGGTTGSLLTGTLFEYFGGTAAFYCSLIPIGGIAIALYFFKRQTDQLAQV